MCNFSHNINYSDILNHTLDVLKSVSAQSNDKNEPYLSFITARARAERERHRQRGRVMVRGEEGEGEIEVRGERERDLW